MMRTTLLVLLIAAMAPAADWPMWRGDAGRSAATSQALPSQPKPAWTLRLPALESAWQEAVNRDRMPYDVCYEPIVVGHRLFVASNGSDSVTAYDTRTGERLWRRYLDAPVRLPPAAMGDRLFVVCDDGALHALSQDEGKDLGKARGGIDDRLVMGNGRLVSPWCARGGPVAVAGRVSFGSGIWPFMGTSVHTVDAATLAPIWQNDGAGSQFMSQPHGGADAFGGVAPQGALALSGDRLLVPSGRSVPAMFDATRGALRYFHLDGSPGVKRSPPPNRKLEGGSHVASNGRLHVNWRALGTVLFDSETGGGYLTWTGRRAPVLTADRFFLGGEKELLGFDLDSLAEEAYEVEVTDRKTGEKQKVQRYRWNLPPMWKASVPSEDALILAGDTLIAASGGTIRALRLQAGSAPAELWTVSIPGTVMELLAADDRLFAVTREGRIHAFAADGTDVRREELPPAAPALETDAAVAQLAKHLPVPEGWCVVFGAGSPARLEAVLRDTPLRVAAFCPDAVTVDALRRHFDAKGLYGRRISVRVGHPGSPKLPPYFAAMVIHEGDADTETAKVIARILRPYGGMAWFPDAKVAGAPAAFPSPRFIVQTSAQGTLVRQPGALPGAADWTHLYGDLSNKAKSDDQRVRLPLGLLWFGGNSHDDILPRHAHGPTELVVGGRLFVQGTDTLTARDVYTGMVFWQRKLGDLGTFGDYYDKTYNPDPTDTTYNQIHIPGANARGTNMVAATDAIYLIRKEQCLVIDPVTGDTRKTFALPPETPGQKPPEWAYVGTVGPWLIAGADFVSFAEQEGDKKPGPFDTYDRTSCQRLVVLDRETGDVKWQRTAELGFRHNTICVGEGKLFCLDTVPAPIAEKRKRRGLPTPPATLLALNLADGSLAWQDQAHAFGTWLSYSSEHHVLMQCGRASRDMLRGEPNDRMVALQAADGKVLWDRKVPHGGPIMLHGDRIILPAPSGTGGALDLLTGKPFELAHPITGKAEPWSYFRRYGCNSVIAAEHFLAFRSGAAGFCDLNSLAGTGNFGGFKSGCTTNLIAADGVLNAPDYTRTCTCSYQNQASLALVPMDDVEPWTANALEYDAETEQVRHLGLNLGAPGDQRDDDGLLWFDFPSVGGPSPSLPVEFVPAERPFTTFQLHPARLKGERSWIAASGIEGAGTLRIRLRNLDPVRTLRTTVTDGADDGEEFGGELNLTSSDLELTRDGKREQLIALRFRDLSLEAGDEVLSAQIRFTVKAPSEEPTSLRIRAEATDSAAPLQPGMAQRQTTSQSITWSPPPWAKVGDSGKEQTTPDLLPLVRDILARPGWTSGGALVFLIDGTGHRCPWSANGKSTAAPVLEITYRRKPKATPPPLACRVQLVFAEPRLDIRAGQRPFACWVNGERVGQLDLCESDGARTAHVLDLPAVAVQEWLEIRLEPAEGAALPPLLSGVSVRVER